LGMSLEDAVMQAKQFVTERIRSLSESKQIGHGALPI